ncbi:hypothetical protein [Methyloglobulus morosus]|uniref:hypothetical protein n=1 Tax=Methyloglobulus morosus TaxID=1410681 RepID=UPI00055E917C|nr:hypothetical protein [Methyloglobulus morosus]
MAINKPQVAAKPVGTWRTASASGWGFFPEPRDFGDMMAVFASSAPALAGALTADEGIIQFDDALVRRHIQ